MLIIVLDHEQLICNFFRKASFELITTNLIMLYHIATKQAKTTLGKKRC